MTLADGRQCNVLIQEAVKTIGNAVGLILICGFIFFCAIAACVITKRRRQRAILKRLLQLQSQHQPPSRPRILVRRSPDIAFGTDVCLCPADIQRFFPDCCSIHSHTTNIQIQKKWTTQTPLLYTSWRTRMVWSTTQGSYTGSDSSDVGVCVGSIISCGFVSFVCLAAWVIVTRRRQRTILKRRRQLESQNQLPAPQRSLDRQSPVLPNMENLTSNPEMNLNVLRTGTYAYGEYSQESVIEGWPPPYTLASQCQPVTPFAPPPYTMRSSHSEPVVLVAPPPYTPASPSVPPPPYSEYI